MIEAILAVLLSFAVSTRDQIPETQAERTERLRVVATAIAWAADRATCYEQSSPCRAVLGDRELAAAVLIVQARRESSLRRDVQIGQCRPHECDRGRAKGPWQTHHAPWIESREQWQSYASLEQSHVQRAAWRTLTLWAGASSKGLHCGFARLAGWGVCWGDYGHDRAAETLRVAARLRGVK